MRGLIEAYRQALLDSYHFEEVCTRLRKYFPSLNGLRILDVGCGVKLNQTALFRSAGVEQIIGIDLDPHIIHDRHQSFGQKLYWRIYYGTLAYKTKQRLQVDHLSLIQADIYDLPLQDQLFDVVISNAVFEHLPDIERALHSLSRVMKPNGLFHIGFHLWPSLSGSHLPAAKWHPLRRKDWPAGVPLWFHLRKLPPYDQAAPGFGYQHQFLNCLRECDYRAAFEKQTKIVEWLQLYREGQEWLTDDLRRELSDFTEDDLTVRSIRVVARPIKPDLIQ